MPNGRGSIPLGCACLALCLLAGCLVRASRYDQALADTARSREENRSLAAELAETQARLQARQSKVAGLEAEANNLQARLDEATALHQQLQKELERLGKNVGAMLESKGVMQQALDDAKRRLAELRTLQAEAQARNAAMSTLAHNLASAGPARKIEVGSDDGQSVLLIPASVLFENGRAELHRPGEGVLAALAQALATTPGWRFRVVVYGPIPKGRGHSVFTLPALRASLVADRLVTLGLAPASLSVSGRVTAPSAQPPAFAGGGMLEGVEIELVDMPGATSPTPAPSGAPAPASPSAPAEAGPTAPR